MSTKLTDAIDDLVREKTFSLDALDAVKSLRDRAQAQEAEIVRLKDEVAAKNTALSEARAQTDRLREREADVNQRALKVSEREAKMQELEVAKAVAQAKSETYGTVFNTIFRNATVRESVVGHRTEIVQQPHNPYPQHVQIPEGRTVERTVD